MSSLTRKWRVVCKPEGGPPTLSSPEEGASGVGCALSIKKRILGENHVGSTTRNSTLYYVLASDEFGATGFGEWVWSSPTILAILTWAPLLMQLAFPWVYFFGRPTPRRVLVVCAIMFHLGILVMMGLGTFALFMIGAELLLLSDDDFIALRLLPRPRGD